MSLYIPGPNRYVCSVLDEMRKQLKSLNLFNIYRFKKIHSLMIEEAQTMVNKMEAGLEDQNDLEDVQNQLKKAKRLLKKKRNELKELNSKLEEHKDAD